jgi:hypothetical protein
MSINSDTLLDKLIDNFIKDMEKESKPKKEEDIIVYDEDTREILAIIPFNREGDAILKKNIDFEVRDANAENIIGIGTKIYLSEE